jgi:hypothetical protein
MSEAARMSFFMGLLQFTFRVGRDTRYPGFCSGVGGRCPPSTGLKWSFPRSHANHENEKMQAIKQFNDCIIA